MTLPAQTYQTEYKRPRVCRQTILSICYKHCEQTRASVFTTREEDAEIGLGTFFIWIACSGPGVSTMATDPRAEKGEQA